MTDTPPNSVMLDIEAYGLTPGSVIKSIGAVKFGGGKIIDRFYRRIDAQSCIRFGLTLDAATVEWWLAQSDEARREMTLPGDNIRDVIMAFDVWVSDLEADIWGNGAAYDNVLFACAARAVGIPAVWAHKKSLCYRTVKNANKHIPLEPYKVGTHHNALDDAESQALHLMAIWDHQARQRTALTLLEVAVQATEHGIRLPDKADVETGIGEFEPQELIAIGNWFNDARAVVNGQSS